MPSGNQCAHTAGQQGNYRDGEHHAGSALLAPLPRRVRGRPRDSAQDEPGDERRPKRVVAGLIDLNGFFPRDATRDGPRFAGGCRLKAGL